MDRLYYQEKIADMLDEAIDNLDVEEFDIFISRVKDMVEECS